MINDTGNQFFFPPSLPTHFRLTMMILFYSILSIAALLNDIEGVHVVHGATLHATGSSE